MKNVFYYSPSQRRIIIDIYIKTTTNKGNAFGYTYITAHIITIFMNINAHKRHKFRYEEVVSY
jgi:hypothetical protein